MHIQFRFLLPTLLAFSLISCNQPDEITTEETDPTRVKTGAEMLIANHLDELQGNRIGLVMNPTARLGVQRAVRLADPEPSGLARYHRL